LNFDHTYILLFGKILFEPVTFLINHLIAIFCIYSFYCLKKTDSLISKNWAGFFLFIGISAIFGAYAHSIQYQLGDAFIRWVIFLVNATSLIAIYFCFNIAYLLSNKPKHFGLIKKLVLVWILILLTVTFIQNNFLLIKIHAGIVLTYSLIIHLLKPTINLSGSKWIAVGIIVSFLSIVVHSTRYSFDEWFNYKDIAHTIMILSLILIFYGTIAKHRLNSVT
jgi:hypothetical protein